MKPLEITSHLFIGCAVLAASCVQAEPYIEISLDLKVEATRPSFPDSTPRAVKVTCVTGPDVWRMENDYITGANRQQWFYDGTNVYLQLESTLHVWPSADGQPLGSVSENVPWLAFCSGCYLKRSGRLIPLPAEDLRHARDRYAYTDQTTAFSDQLGLPKMIDLFASKSLLEKSENDFDRENFFGDRWAEAKKRALARIEEGKLTFHYEATASTNFLGQTFPTEFTFYQKGRPYEQNGDWTWTGSGKVTALRQTEKPTGLLAGKQKSTVIDNRFPGGMIYSVTSASLSPTNDPALQIRYAARADGLKRMQEFETERRLQPKTTSK